MLTTADILAPVPDEAIKNFMRYRRKPGPTVCWACDLIEDAPVELPPPEDRWSARQTLAFAVATCVTAWWAIFLLVGYVAKARGFR